MHKKVFSTSFFLAGASVIEKVGSFLTVPILTGCLTPVQYGELTASIAYVGMLSLIYHCGLSSSLSRWYSMWQESWDKKLYEKYIFTIITSFAIFVGWILILLNSFYPLSYLIGIDFNLFMAVFISGIFLIPFSIRSAIWAIEGKAFFSVLFGLFKTLFFLCLIYYFLPKFKSPFVKPCAEIISLFIISLFLFKSYYSRNYPKFKEVEFSKIKDVLKESFYYGFSMQLSQILFWIIASSDRILISRFLNNSAVGFYSILMISIMPVFLIVSFNNSFSVYYLKLMSEENNIKKACNYVFQYLLFGGIIIFIYKLFLYLFNKKIILLLATKEYLSVAGIFHFGADILFFYTAYLLFSRNLHFYKDNKAIIFIMIISSVINILGNILLIPIFGINGSFYASIFSYFVMAVISIGFLYREVKFPYVKGILAVFSGFSIVYILFDIFSVY